MPDDLCMHKRKEENSRKLPFSYTQCCLVCCLFLYSASRETQPVSLLASAKRTKLAAKDSHFMDRVAELFINVGSVKRALFLSKSGAVLLAFCFWWLEIYASLCYLLQCATGQEIGASMGGSIELSR